MMSMLRAKLQQEPPARPSTLWADLTPHVPVHIKE